MPTMTQSTNDTSSEATFTVSTGTTIFTPATEPEDSWDGRVYSIPWPGNTYIILEKASEQVIYTKSNGDVWIDGTSGEHDPYAHWQCVEQNGYFGFKNVRTGGYLGHDGGDGIKATARALLPWELFTTRKHPEGGYQVLLPHYWHTLMLLSVAENGKRLHRRDHGTTVWEFIKV